MAQTLCFAPPMMVPNVPSSPDPTPLRMLAFSVAEAALQSDPNSPSLSCLTSNFGVEGDWSGSWSKVPEHAVKGTNSTSGVKGTRRLWDVVERAKERRVRVTSSPSGMTTPLPISPPVSPAKYNFVLPANSQLAASIAASPDKSRTTPPRLALSLSPRSTRAFPLYTRSAEPSPTDSTFAGLDQRQPPPEFVPRVSAADFSNRKENVSPSQRLRCQVASNPSTAAAGTKGLGAVPSPSRHTARLPSLAQIQAKMAKAGHRRNASAGSIPIPVDTIPSVKKVQRTSSSESVEVIQTPTDEFPPPAVRPRIVTGNAHPPTPPSPAKEPRLAPFLRERMSGRLANANAKARPLSMPPLRTALNVLNLPGLADGPVLTVTTPNTAATAASAARKSTVPPPSPSRVSMLATPPRRTTPLGGSASPSPSSPTGSIRSFSTGSPTLSVPMITCTPAPSRLVRNGVEQDSDEEEGDVVLFEGESEMETETEEDERVEREKRGKEMLEKLLSRRRSS